MDRYTEDGISLSMDLSGFDINAGTLNGIDQDQITSTLEVVLWEPLLMFL